MGFSNPVAGGLYLIRPALRSPNYSPGTAGWTINVDGSAEFASLIARGEVDTGTAPSGTGVQLTTGGEVRIWKSGVLVGSWVSSTGILSTIGATGAKVALDPTGPYLAFIDSTGLNTTTLAQSVVGAIITLTLGAATFLELGSTIVRSGNMYYNTAGAGTHDDWNAATLGSGWTNRGTGFPNVSYRLAPSPANSLQLAGEAQSGTVTNGTTLFTLPAGWRPATEQIIVCGYSTGTNIARLQINTSGAVNIFNAGATAGIAGIIQINNIVPLDL